MIVPCPCVYKCADDADHLPTTMLSSVASGDMPALPPIPAISRLQSISISSLVHDFNPRLQLLLPPIALPSSSGAPVVVPLPRLNPALFLNDQRPTFKDDDKGFGPGIINTIKWTAGIRCFDNPICVNPLHETGFKRINVFRQMSSCRTCVQEAVETIPPHATHMQTVRFVTALFRNYFCPFCLLVENDRSKMHLVTAKMQCKKHKIINRSVFCRHEKQLWQNCRLCSFDPRAATAICACGKLLRDKHLCTCDPSLKALSYGIRYGINPFKVPTAAEQEQDAEWVRLCIEEADSMRLRAGELEGQLPPKRVRRCVARAQRFVKPLLLSADDAGMQ